MYLHSWMVFLLGNRSWVAHIFIFLSKHISISIYYSVITLEIFVNEDGPELYETPTMLRVHEFIKSARLYYTISLKMLLKTIFYS